MKLEGVLLGVLEELEGTVGRDMIKIHCTHV